MTLNDMQLQERMLPSQAPPPQPLLYHSSAQRQNPTPTLVHWL